MRHHNCSSSEEGGACFGNENPSRVICVYVEKMGRDNVLRVSNDEMWHHFQ